MRDFGVRNSSGGFEIVGECAEAGAEDQRDFGTELGFAEDEFCGFVGLQKFRSGFGGLFFGGHLGSRIPISENTGLPAKQRGKKDRPLREPRTSSPDKPSTGCKHAQPRLAV